MNEVQDFLNVIEEQSGIDDVIKNRVLEECRPFRKEEYIFEDAYLGGTMRTFITQFSPERFLNMLTNIGELLVELLGLEQEKIIFAIDCDDNLSSDIYQQKLVGYYIRHCAKSSCENITIRVASKNGCSDMEMLYSYLSCRSYYKEICLSPDGSKEEKRNLYLKHMNKIAFSKYGEDVNIPKEFIYYTYPDIGQFLSYINEWNATNLDKKTQNVFLYEKAQEFLNRTNEMEDTIYTFVTCVGEKIMDYWEKEHKICKIHFNPKSKYWREKIITYKRLGLICQCGNWIKRTYAFYPIVYPFFGLFLEDFLDEKEMCVIEVTEEGLE